MKAGPRFHELSANAGVFRRRQAANGDGIEKTLGQQRFTDGCEIGRAGGDERLQRGFARLEAGLSVEGDLPDGFQGAAVAEQDGEIGETVPVRSTWNGSKLMGRVTGQRKARIE